MSIIEAIKLSVERLGCTFLYHADGEMNELVACEVAFSGDAPVVLCYLLGNGSTEIVGGIARERVNVGLFFSKKTEYDFNAIENERIIDECKQYAQRWLLSLNSDIYIRLVTTNSTERVYDTTTDILTAYAVNVTLEQVQGQTLCGFEPALKRMLITANGTYDVSGYDRAEVSVLPTSTDITITKNGTYLPKDYGVDAFKKVTCDAVFGNILITEPSILGETIIPRTAVRADLNSWDVSSKDGARRGFLRCTTLIELRVNKWDTSNFVDINNLFSFCTVLPELDVKNWDVSKVTNILYTFEAMYEIEFLDLSLWDLRSVTTGGNLTFSTSRKLKSLIGYTSLKNDKINYDVICMNNLSSTLSLQWQTALRYTSILAIANGIATVSDAQTLTFSKTAFNNMKNDDDTVPSADVIAERQNNIRTICANKNWNLALV